MTISAKFSLAPGQAVCRCLVVLTSICVALPKVLAGAEPLHFNKLFLDEGLSQSQVSAILQDRIGFMWFGTFDGLNRYDGYSFRVFKNDPSDARSLSYNLVTALCETSKAERWEIWVGTSEGLNRFDPHLEQFEQYRSNPAQPGSLSSDSITALLEDRQGRIWVGTTNGLNLMQREKVQGQERISFISFLNNPDDSESLSHNSITALWEDREEARQVLWVATREGLNRVEILPGSSPQHVAIRSTRFSFRGEDPFSLIHDTVWDVAQTRDGTVWVTTSGGGIHRFVDKRLERYPTSAGVPVSADVRRAIEDERGRLWFATFGEGLLLLEPGSRRLTSLRDDPGNPGSIPGDWVISLYQDRSRRLWVGTTGSGVGYHDPGKRQIPRLTHQPHDPDSLSHRSVLSVAEDARGRLWIGTADGLNRYDFSTGLFNRYRSGSDPGSLPHKLVHSIWPESDPGKDHIWVGTSAGLGRLDVASGTFETFRHDPADPYSLPDNEVRSITEAASGELWIGTSGGLARLSARDRDRGRFVSLKPVPDNPRSLIGEEVLCVYVDSRQNVWVGTRKGLSRFDPALEEFTNYPKGERGPSDQTVYSLLEDRFSSRRILWVGTRNGLDRFDLESGQWSRYTEQDGLPNSVVAGLQQDGQGRIWISTFHGLSRFEPENGSFFNFDPGDGLQSYEFNAGADHRGPDGRLYFGGIEGLNYFHPESIGMNPVAPPVVLTSVRVFDQPLELGQAVPTLDRLELAHDQHSFSLEFAALDFAAPEKNQYAYRLEGFEKNWHFAGSRRFAAYTNVPPGDYLFQVKASNNDGVWNEAGVGLSIQIRPPLWKTWWAYLLYATAGAGALYVIRRVEMNRLRLSQALEIQRLEARKLAELDRLKSHFFANVTHELRTPLTLILGPLERLLSHDFEGDPAHQYGLMYRSGRRLLGLINQLLDLSRLEAGGLRLEKKRANLAGFVRIVTSCFQSSAEEKGITLRYEVAREPIPVDFDAEQLEKCLVNLLSNALKFTPEGGAIQVRLSVRENGSFPEHGPDDPAAQWVALEVVDNGIGIPARELDSVFERFYQVHRETRMPLGSGIGLALTRELVEMHDGDIQVESREGHGTRFLIRLPLADRVPDAFQELSQPAPGAPQESCGQASPSLPGFEGSPEAPAARENGEGSPLILVVEDDPDMRMYLSQVLSPACQMLEAGQAQTGLELAFERIPDLIVSDVMMPGLNGFELASRLKTDERTSHIPIILLTALASVDRKVEGLETGADDYLTKPFSARELRARVSNLIEQRRLLRERFRQRLNLETAEITLTNADGQFLKRIQEIVNRHLEEFDFGVQQLAEGTRLSRMQLHRKLKALTGQTPGELIRTLRLQAAARLLRQPGATVTQVALSVGFSNLSHFAKSFREFSGSLPSEYQNSRLNRSNDS